MSWERWLPAPGSRLHVAKGLTGGTGVPGPGLLLFFLDSVILSSVSFQTLGDHTALFQTPRAGQRVPRLSSRTRPRSWGKADFMLQPLAEKQALVAAWCFWATSLAGAEEVTETFTSSHSRGFCFIHRASFWRGSVSKIYEYIHQGLRYWMILYKLLSCFSAQLVA